MNSGVLSALLVAGGFVLFYYVLLVAISHIDGWRALARHFAVGPAAERPREFRRFVSGHLLGDAWWQRASFDFSLRTAETEAGLYVVPHWWVAPGHHLLCIPWDAIASAERRTLHWPRTARPGEYLELRFAAPDLRLRLDLTASAISRSLPGDN